MPEPLDYESRQPNRQPSLPSNTARAAVPGPVSDGPLRAVPAEFDALLVRTDDHGAIQGIEASLRREKIAAFRDHDGAVVGRTIALFIASADLPRASLMRDEVFKRREKFKQYPRQNVDALGTKPNASRSPNQL